jgi:uncharacterized heparinase superfamily protein
VGRLTRLIPRLPEPAAATPGTRPRQGAFGAPILRPGPLRQGTSFRFLNRQGTVAEPPDWNAGEHAKLWLYNLHYFDWLREEAAPRRMAEDGEWIDKWIEHNPARYGVGWEPYPSSLRIVNWIVWFLTGGAATGSRLDSLATQVRHLARSVEYHLLGNHLLANAKALVFAGAFFEGAQADRWRLLGLNLLRRELPEQILADGAHFELSPMYHALILEDLLDLLGLGAVYPDALAQPSDALGLTDIAGRMARWLGAVVHPDGEIPFFNDATLGIAPSPTQLFAYAAMREIHVRPDTARCKVLQPSGYAVLRSAGLSVIFDCGRVGPDYLPGHAHADTLSFELSAARERVVVNSGTSTYAAGPDREWERSTRAHATVEIGGVSSAETWASFRVGRRPNVGAIEHGTAGDADWVECRHDGYAHLAGAPIHRRRVEGTTGSVRVTDWIEGAGRQRALGSLPIHPDMRVEAEKDGSYRITTRAGRAIDVIIAGPVHVDLVAGRFAPGFGIVIERPVIEWRWQGTLPVSVETHFRLLDAT